MVNRKSVMKVNLCESLREVMLKKPFEKITIKNVCDQAGVIRATFYNHFEDKYDCLNAIVYQDMHDFYDSEQNNGVDKLVQGIFDQKEFYRVAYRIEGNYSFKDIMIDNIAIFINAILKKKRNNYLKDDFSDLFLSRYYATMIELFVQEWIFSDQPFDGDKLKKLLDSSFHDFVS